MHDWYVFVSNLFVEIFHMFTISSEFDTSLVQTKTA